MENDKSKKQYDPVLLPIFVLAISYRIHPGSHILYKRTEF